MIFAIDLNPIDDIIDGIGGLIGGAAEAAGEAVLDLVVSFVFGLIADAVAAITNSIITAMDSTTGVDLEGGFFPALTPIRQVVLGMSMALLLAFFFAAIIRSLAAGEPGAVIRTALVDVPAAIGLMIVSVTVAWILIRIIDEASLAVTGDVGEAMGEFSASLVAVEALTGAGLLGIIFGLLFIIGAILVWLQLLVRSALIYIVIVLAPLGFATRAHPGTRQIARRTIEMAVALIVSKFGVAVAFGVGAAAIESSNPVGGGEVDLAGMMTGVAVMLMAAFMPWLIWKVFPFADAATAAAGVERSPVRAGVAGASMAVAATVGISKLAGAGGPSGTQAGGGQAGAAGAPGAGDSAGPAGGNGPGGAPGSNGSSGAVAVASRPASSSISESSPKPAAAAERDSGAPLGSPERAER